ncbi:MAG: sporulation integral membrane protein YtvI [Clostridia bacterium]|nr:sporulation integral membrane protein YtvI [Clostridia bacterium]
MDKYKKIAFGALCVVILIVLGYIFFEYVFEILFPFIVAFLIVAMARPLINKLQKKTKIPKPVVSVLVLSIILLVGIAIIGVVGVITINQIIDISEDVISSFSENDGYITDLFAIIDSLEEKAPFLRGFLKEGETLSSLVSELVLDGAKNISVSLTSALGRFISALPNIVVTIIVLVLSLYYFAKDYDKIGERVFNFLPKRVGRIALIFKNDVLHVVTKYLKSYFILFILCFAELFSGFLIINQKNAFVLALIISIVDILPILGAGTVLVPWGIVMLILGNYKLAIGLFILAGVTYFSRQILEPKILSSQMNVHPLITLFAMFVGLKIAGFLGLIIAPIVAFVIKITIDRIKNQKNVENIDNV